MHFEYSPKVRDLLGRLERFMEDHVYPAEHEYHDFIERSDNRWVIPPVMEQLKARARSEGLWNLFLAKFDDYGSGLTNLEYAPLAEVMGRSFIGPEVFNCNAPDTGNMELLARYGLSLIHI